MNMNQRVTLSSEVLSQEVSGETVLLDMQSESYFGLDEVGTRIWQLLQEKEDLQAVFDAMLVEYDVETDRLERDLEELIARLEEAGLLSLREQDEV
ncbi:MAG: PqqD family protein [Pseudomonadota bacterium]